MTVRSEVEQNPFSFFLGQQTERRYDTDYFGETLCAHKEATILRVHGQVKYNFSQKIRMYLTPEVNTLNVIKQTLSPQADSWIGAAV
jgi:hypothetical protein